jgi:phage N-6-adenine-methyltransferase
MLRLHSDADLDRLLDSVNFTLDPTNPSKAIRLSEGLPPCPIIGHDLDQLIATGQSQWRKIKTDEKYLTAAHWEFAGTLAEIKQRCGDDHAKWTAAYKRIGIDRRRVSELLQYRIAFKTRTDAAKVQVTRANKLIRKAVRAEAKPGEYDPMQDCFETPQWLYDVLDAEFHFGLDAAATDECHKCAVYLTPKEDALTVNWHERSGGRAIFLNSPFERHQLPRFVEKAYDESQHGPEVTCVLPYYKSYPWFRDVVWTYAEVRQIQGQVVFDGFGPKFGKHAGNIAGPQSFDTIVGIFRPGQKGFSGPYIDRPGAKREVINLPIARSEARKLVEIEREALRRTTVGRICPKCGHRW